MTFCNGTTRWISGQVGPKWTPEQRDRVKQMLRGLRGRKTRLHLPQKGSKQ